MLDSARCRKRCWQEAESDPETLNSLENSRQRARDRKWLSGRWEELEQAVEQEYRSIWLATGLVLCHTERPGQAEYGPHFQYCEWDCIPADSTGQLLSA